MNIDEIWKIICNNFEKYCCDGNYDKIKEYLENFKALANHNDGEFFEIVTDKGNLELIKLFVESGADIHVNENYALYTCAYHDYDDCVIYLLSIGANIEDIKNTCGYKNALKIRENFSV